MARKMRKFREGDFVSFSEEITGAPKRKLPGQSDYVSTESATETVSDTAAKPKKQTFAEAFKAARAEKGAGKTFTWGGKSYSTNMAGEGAGRPATTRSSSATTTTTSKPAAPKAEEKPSVNVDNRFINRSGNTPLRANAGNKPAASRPAAKPQSQQYSARAAELTREANQERAAEKAKGSAGARARFKNMFGFGSDAAERAAKNYTRMAEGVGRQERAKPKSRPLLLTGEAAREANRKLGTIGGKAKGGSVRSIDGCAVRGKTRAGRK